MKNLQTLLITLCCTACTSAPGGTSDTNPGSGKADTFVQQWDERTLDEKVREMIAWEEIAPIERPATEAAQVSLGQMLFFDKELSGTRDIACGTCHHPTLGTGDDLSLSVGVGGVGLGPTRALGQDHDFIPRNAPDVFNRGVDGWEVMMWDERIAQVAGEFVTPAKDNFPAEQFDHILQAQAMFPVTSSDEMRGGSHAVDLYGSNNELGAISDMDHTDIWKGLMERLLAIPAYVELFERAFPEVPQDELQFAHAARAIAAFETQAFTMTESPWNRYLRGENVLSEQEKQGALVFFGAGRCGSCHSGTLLSDQKSHNICAPQVGPGKGDESPDDFGRFRETKNQADKYAFRTPPLHNVGFTGPYMHDGAYTSLEAAVLHHLSPSRSVTSYDDSQLEDRLVGRVTVGNEEAMLEGLDPILANGINLSSEEFDALMAFLRALDDPETFELGQWVPSQVPSGHPVD